MNTELKPCPLCGREHEIDIDEEGGVSFWHKGNINNCILYEQELNPPDKIERFVAKWNTRPIEDELTRQRDLLLKLIKDCGFEIRFEPYDNGEHVALYDKHLLRFVFPYESSLSGADFSWLKERK